MCTEPPQELAGAGTTSVAAAAATVVAVHGRTAVAVAVLLVGLPVVLETKRMGHKHHIRRFHRARAREQGGGLEGVVTSVRKSGRAVLWMQHVHPTARAVHITQPRKKDLTRKSSRADRVDGCARRS